jgi:hypothetical protein
MIVLQRVAKLGGVAVVLAALSVASVAADPPADEVAAIHALDQAFVKAYNSGDVTEGGRRVHAGREALGRRLGGYRLVAVPARHVELR